MAISKMYRFSAVTLRSQSESLSAGLQRLRCVDIISTPIDPDAEGFESNRSQEASARLSSEMNAAVSAEAFLAGYVTKKKSFLSAPEEISLDSITDSLKRRCIKTVNRALELRDEIKTESARLSALKNELSALTPWVSFAHELPESKTDSTKSVSGTLAAKLDISKLSVELEPFACVIEELTRSESEVFVRLTAYNGDFDSALTVLNSFAFAVCPCKATEADGFAQGKARKTSLLIKETSDKLDVLESEAKALAELHGDAELYIDLLMTEEARREAEDSFAASDRTVVVTGWVPADDREKVEKFLDERGDAYSFEEAEEDPEAPIKFKNNAFAAQFEPVVELYSPPAYGAFDPTGIMSIFYVIIFGLMLADVGYGLLLSLGCFFGIKLMKPEGSMKKMLTMFGICGISCIVMGVLFGGYFSDAPQIIMENWFGIENPPDFAILFNPLTSPIPFLVVSLGIGALHLICALGIKFYVLWVRGKKVEAVCDVGSWIILFLGIGLFLIVKEAGLVLTAIGALMLICTQGRHEKNIIMKVFKGVASLYDIVSYFSDLLSYSRILALGLASMVVGSVFNILGGLPGLSFIGVIVFVAIFSVGHLLNMGVNLLGTFVHTSRLQYIEFFGKFYEDGGRMFAPLTPRSKYVRFK